MMAEHVEKQAAHGVQGEAGGEHDQAGHGREQAEQSGADGDLAHFQEALHHPEAGANAYQQQQRPWNPEGK